MWIYDLDTLKFLEVNAAALNHYGYTREEFLKLNVKDIRPKEDIPAAFKSIMAASIEPIRKAGTWRHKKKNGELIYVNIITHDIDFEEP